MATACADRPAPGDPLERGDGFRQMILFQRPLLRHPVLPHVIGDLVAALANRAQRFGVELANPPGCEDRRLETPCTSNSSMSRQMPTRPPNSPFASCMGGSLSSRRSNIASKSQVKLMAMRIPSGQVRPG